MRGLLVALLLLTAAAPAQAVPSYTEKLYIDAKAAIEPDRPSVRKFIVVVAGNQGAPAQWVGRQARKKLSDGRRTLTVFMEPEAVKGFALLVWERVDQPPLEWVYLAPVRRVLKGIDLDEFPFIYSDLTFADLGVMKLGDRQLTLLGAEQRAGKRTFKIQEVPREERAYARIITWLPSDTKLPMEREYYDAADALLKTERFDVQAVDGALLPIKLRVENKIENTNTELHVSDVHYDIDVPDRLFDPSKLGQVADDPFWQSEAANPPPPAPPANP